MFNTIKSKIFVITISMFLILVFIFLMFTFLYYRDTKSLMFNTASMNVATLAKNINKELIKIENNAKDLALMGELYYKFDKNQYIAEQTIIQVFNNYPESLGGGVWFKPYIMNPAQMLSCIYAFRDKDGKIVMDREYESIQYNYLNQNWYKEILPNVSKEDNIEWSFPYYEKQGKNTLMITAGAGMYDDNGNLIGISTVDWDIHDVMKAVVDVQPTKHSFALFANPEKDYIIVSTDPFLRDGGLIGKSLKNIPWYKSDLLHVKYMDYHNVKYIPYVKTMDNGMELIVCIPTWELFDKIKNSVLIFCFILLLISFAVAYMLYIGLRSNIISPISKLIFIANKISQGDSNVEIKIENPVEFAKLASTFNKMTKDIQSVAKEKERINSELSIAKSIQKSSLPAIFPPFPERKEFDIYASMDAAKEVGGDFYDFYFIDENHFMFLIADVSGKGIPAALFMMTTKTLISNISQIVKNPEELIMEINKKICANNKNNMFITMLAGVVDICSGKITYINCGHNPPLVMSKDGEFKYLELESNSVLGVIEDADFEVYEAQLNSGDIIFTYTDGITEALNDSNEMYGPKRLLNKINEIGANTVYNLIEDIKNDIKKFAGNIEQSDDITMLAFKYNGSDSLKEIFNDYATADNYHKFYEWLHNVCEKWSLDSDLANKLDMCSEEIYANIEFYAYNGEKGVINVSVSKNNQELIMEFTDFGIEYNPLLKPDPDITLPPQERPLGGLGIFMVKQMADFVEYKRDENKNILILHFKL